MGNSYLMITGATGGLGSAFAVECARQGYDLFLTDLHGSGTEFANTLGMKFNVDVRYQACDLTDTEARSEFYAGLGAEGYRFCGLINVAGIDHEGGFLERSREQLLQIIQLNIESTIDTTYAALNLRNRERRFMLINVSSLAAFYPMPYKIVYAASKRFLLDFTLAIREEIAPYGTATALCPAGLPTKPETIQRIIAQGFWGRLTTMDTRYVVRRTLKLALRGKPYYVPGVLNQLLQGLSALLPRTIVSGFVGRRWKTLREEDTLWSIMGAPQEL